MHYGDSKTISLKVYGINGYLADIDHVVKIKIGDKTFTAKTDKKELSNSRFQIL